MLIVALLTLGVVGDACLYGGRYTNAARDIAAAALIHFR